MYLNLFSRMIAVAAIAAGSMLPIAANASTVSCPGTAGGDQITLDVSALTSCSSTTAMAHLALLLVTPLSPTIISAWRR